MSDCVCNPDEPPCLRCQRDIALKASVAQGERAQRAEAEVERLKEKILRLKALHTETVREMRADLKNSLRLHVDNWGLGDD